MPDDFIDAALLGAGVCDAVLDVPDAEPLSVAEEEESVVVPLAALTAPLPSLAESRYAERSAGTFIVDVGLN